MRHAILGHSCGDLSINQRLCGGRLHLKLIHTGRQNACSRISFHKLRGLQGYLGILQGVSILGHSCGDLSINQRHRGGRLNLKLNHRISSTRDRSYTGNGCYTRARGIESTSSGTGEQIVASSSSSAPTRNSGSQTTSRVGRRRGTRNVAESCLHLRQKLGNSWSGYVPHPRGANVEALETTSQVRRKGLGPRGLPQTFEMLHAQR